MHTAWAIGTVEIIDNGGTEAIAVGCLQGGKVTNLAAATMRGAKALCARVAGIGERTES